MGGLAWRVDRLWSLDSKGYEPQKRVRLGRGRCTATDGRTGIKGDTKISASSAKAFCTNAFVLLRMIVVCITQIFCSKQCVFEVFESFSR